MFYRRYSLFWIIYIIIGVIVAARHNYFDHLGGLDKIVSTVFEVLLWPLVLIGIDINVH